MDLLNDDLRSVLDKFGYLGVNLEGGVEIDGRYLGPKAEITSKDLHIIIDAVNRGKQLLQNNAMRLTVHEFSGTFPNPDDAYKFMAALTHLKNKAGTRIYYVAPFGNFTSLHYQGLIQNAVVPDDEPKAIKADKKIDVKPNDDKSSTVTITGPVELEKGAKLEIKTAETEKDKPKTPRKSEKSETKAPAKRTSPKKRK